MGNAEVDLGVILGVEKICHRLLARSWFGRENKLVTCKRYSMIQQFLIEWQLSAVFLSEVSGFQWSITLTVLRRKFVKFQPVYAIGRYQGSKQERKQSQ